MKGWLVKELGNHNDVLTIERLNKPIRQQNEVLIEVKATALNFFEILVCQGKYQEKPPLPFTIGSEVSGIVVEAPENSLYKVGQRVLAQLHLPNGGLTEYVSVRENAVFPIPDQMDWSEAAAFFITYHTAYYSLFNRAHIKPGEVLLVHAGAGGVGSAAIQLGKSCGAFVIATAGGEEKTRICRELGADIAIDYLLDDFVKIVKEATNGQGADVIFDPVGGKVFDQSRKCIAFDGRLLVIGFAGGEIPSAPANHILVKNYAVVGVHWGYFAKLYPELVEKEHQELMALYSEGKIKPLIYQEYAFEEVKEALNRLAGRKTWGKVVIKV